MFFTHISRQNAWAFTKGSNFKRCGTITFFFGCTTFHSSKVCFHDSKNGNSPIIPHLAEASAAGCFHNSLYNNRTSKSFRTWHNFLFCRLQKVCAVSSSLSYKRSRTEATQDTGSCIKGAFLLDRNARNQKQRSTLLLINCRDVRSRAVLGGWKAPSSNGSAHQTRVSNQKPWQWTVFPASSLRLFKGQPALKGHATLALSGRVICRSHHRRLAEAGQSCDEPSTVLKINKDIAQVNSLTNYA